MRLFWALLKIEPQTSEGRRLISFLTLSFCGGVLSGPVSSLLSVYVDSVLHQPPIFTSSLLAFQMATTGIFALLSGAVADGLGQKRTILLGLMGIPLATSVFILHDFYVLTVVVVSLGVTNALQAIGGQSYLLAASPKTKIGGFTALYFLGNTLGGAVGNVAAGPSAQRWGFGAVGVIGFVLAIMLVAITFRFLPDASSTPVDRRSSAGELLRSYASLARRRDILLVGAIRLLPTSFYGTTSLLLPLLVFRLSNSIAIASIYASTSLLVSMSSQQVVGRIIDRLGPLGPVRVLTAMVPVVALGASLAAESLPALFLSGIIATATLWCISTTIPPLVREVVDTAIQGRALGFVHLVWSTGMLIGTLTGGALVPINPHLPFAVFAAINLFTFPAALALTGSMRGPQMKSARATNGGAIR